MASKLQRYKPESNNMPFHWALLGKDRMALFSFIQSINTTLGMSIFENIIFEIGQENFKIVKRQHVIGTQISESSMQIIDKIMTNLETTEQSPNAENEYELLKNSISTTNIKRRLTKVDIYLESTDGNVYLIDVKTAKGNSGEFKGLKRNLLEWKATALLADNTKTYHSLLGIPYNPYEPQPYQRWTLKGIIDVKDELKVAKDLWDFVGGEGAYEQTLKIFEEVGLKMKKVIDAYFENFH